MTRRRVACLGHAFVLALAILLAACLPSFAGGTHRRAKAAANLAVVDGPDSANACPAASSQTVQASSIHNTQTTVAQDTQTSSAEQPQATPTPAAQAAPTEQPQSSPTPAPAQAEAQASPTEQPQPSPTAQVPPATASPTPQPSPTAQGPSFNQVMPVPAPTQQNTCSANNPNVASRIAGVGVGCTPDEATTSAITNAKHYCTGEHDPKCDGGCADAAGSHPCRAAATMTWKTKVEVSGAHVKKCTNEKGFEAWISGDLGCRCFCP